VRELAEEGIMTDRVLAAVLVGHVIKLPSGDVVAIVDYERVGVLWLHARVVEAVTMTRGTVFMLDPAVALDAELQEVADFVASNEVEKSATPAEEFWCTRTDVHEEIACRGPEEREIASNDFGPRRKR
jgi:hypothetical protein